MFNLMPKTNDFFSLFERAAENAHEGVKVLNALLADYTDVENKTRQIKNIEHAGDEITHRVFDILNNTFITPIDREDIHEIASRIDDIIDMVDTATNRMLIYGIKEPTEDAKALAEVLLKATGSLVKAVALFKNMKNSETVLECCIDIHTQENEGDRVLQHALGKLFDGNTSAVDIIKWKDIYYILESATDVCEDVADVLRTVVLKNA